MRNLFEAENSHTEPTTNHICSFWRNMCLHLNWWDTYIHRKSHVRAPLYSAHGQKNNKYTTTKQTSQSEGLFFLPLLEHLWITRQVNAFSKWVTSPCVASSQRALNRGSGRPGSGERRKERGQGECVGESADPECATLPPPSPQQYLQLHVQTIQLNLGSKDATSQVKGCSSAPGYSHLRSAAQKRKWNPGSRQEFSTQPAVAWC